MSIDLGTPVLDVAIGLAFVFFLLSLIVTAGVELVAWVWKKRAKDLARGIERLLGDDTASRAILEHPLVKSDVTAAAGKKRPSYLSARNFALALTQNLRKGSVEVEKAKAQLRAGVEAVPECTALGIQLRALLESAEGDVAAFRSDAEKWFDDAMDRVSGWYKRWSQLVAVVIALAVAVGLNVDAIRITERLADDPALRAVAVAGGIKEIARVEASKGAAEIEAGDEAAAAAPGAGESTDPTAADSVEPAAAAIDELKQLPLPILWSEANDNVTINTVLGWLVTTFAICLGAPFWFDTLSRLARLRTTGKRPETEPPK